MTSTPQEQDLPEQVEPEGQVPDDGEGTQAPQASAGAEDGTAEGSAEADAEAPSRLDEEGDAAADYLEELLDIADLDGDIDIEVRSGRVHVSITAEEGDEQQLETLVGRDGATLEALQELTRLAVLSGTGQRSRFILDIGGHRARRSDDLKTITDEAIESVRSSGEEAALSPMSAYERKQVHDLVAEAGLVSDSEGEGSRRHVVIRPGQD